MRLAKWKIVRVQFQTDDAGYKELERVLKTMFEDRLHYTQQDA